MVPIGITIGAVEAGGILRVQPVESLPTVGQAIAIGIRLAGNGHANEARGLQVQAIAVVNDLDVMLAGVHAAPVITQVALARATEAALDAIRGCAVGIRARLNGAID